MVDHGDAGTAARDYAEAYKAHYSGRDLTSAIHLYKNLVASHENSPEAGYSFAQIQNIVKSVVPARDLLDAQAGLALAYLEEAASADDVTPALVTPPSKSSTS